VLVCGNRIVSHLRPIGHDSRWLDDFCTTQPVVVCGDVRSISLLEIATRLRAIRLVNRACNRIIIACSCSASPPRPRRPRRAPEEGRAVVPIGWTTDAENWPPALAQTSGGPTIIEVYDFSKVPTLGQAAR